MEKIYPVTNSFLFLPNQTMKHYQHIYQSPSITRSLNTRMCFFGKNYISNETLSQLLHPSRYMFLMGYQFHSHSLLNSIAHGVIPIVIVIDFPEILEYGIESSNVILLDLYNTFTFEDTPLFKRIRL